ncbi:MAG: DUF58 domain-containing protein [Planctomyces sp.]|nr:DUF58 domain-containing protein [Planctomyces sp.]MBA4120819.1 DUF58 domain-containing protein [Isosphaera sp.]
MQTLQSPTRPRSIDQLLDPRLVSRLSQLDVTSRKILAGKLKGERRSKRRGQSVEFADHRLYVPGDDLRHIDWNIFGRLDRLFLKLFLEEEDLGLHVVLDASRSHDAGEPSKWLFMQRLACALGYVALSNLHRLTVWSMAGASITLSERAGAPDEPPEAGRGEPEPERPVVSAVRDLRGRRRLADLARFLLGQEPMGVASFTEAAKRIALARRGKGVMVVLSDFFIKEGYQDGLRLLAGRGFDLFAVQVLSPQEVEPTLGGDLRLRDCEDGDLADVTITAPLLARYKQTLAAYSARLRDFCARRDVTLQVMRSDTPVESALLDHFRRRGLLA